MHDATQVPAMRRLAWKAQALLVRGCFALARSLGPRRASSLGGAILRGIGPRLPVSHVGRRNLELAFPTASGAWREATLRLAWDNLGRSMMEMPLVATLGATEAGPGWEVTGAEHLPKPGQRAIMLSAHLANWEVLPRASLLYGIVLGSLYRAPDNPYVDAEIRRMRHGSAPLPLFPKGAKGGRQALRHLSQGGVLGLLADQKLNEGLELSFLGQPAMTASALAEFALRFRCPVIPVHVQRIGPCRFRVVVEPPLPHPDSGDRQADIRSLTLAANERMGDWIKARPGEWLWLHRRFPKAVYR